MTLLMIVVGGTLSSLGNVAGETSSADELDAGIGLALVGGFVGLLFSIAGQVAYTLLSAALIRGALDAVDGREVSLGSMFERWDKLQVILAALVVGILTFVGILLCILPGIVVIFLSWFTTYFIVDRGLNAIEGLKASWRFAADHVGPLLLLAVLGILCSLAGLLACFVGLLVAIPVVTIASAYTLRTLHDQPVAP
jgi:uncharacterized membrane protein